MSIQNLGREHWFHQFIAQAIKELREVSPAISDEFIRGCADCRLPGDLLKFDRSCDRVTVTLPEGVFVWYGNDVGKIDEKVSHYYLELLFRDNPEAMPKYRSLTPEEVAEMCEQITT